MVSIGKMKKCVIMKKCKNVCDHGPRSPLHDVVQDIKRSYGSSRRDFSAIPVTT